MVAQRLTGDVCRTGFLLDGFPRTVAQAKALEDLLRDRDCAIDAVLELDAPEDEVVARLLARGREDDTEEVIRHRQQLYRKETAPLLEFYADRLVTVPAVGSVSDVTARALDATVAGTRQHRAQVSWRDRGDARCWCGGGPNLTVAQGLRQTRGNHR
jgi:adenylate kinase